MFRNLSILLASTVIALVACDSSPDAEDGGAGAAGEGGVGGANAGRGGAGAGRGGTQSGGTNSRGGAAGAADGGEAAEAGAGGEPNGDAGSNAASGGSGASQSAGGASGDGGEAAEGGTGGANDSGGAAGTGSVLDGQVEHRPDLYGPVTNDEAATRLPRASIFAKGAIDKLRIAADGSIYALGTQLGRLSKFDPDLDELWSITTPTPAPPARSRIIDLPLRDMVLLPDGGVAVTGTLLNLALVGHTASGDYDVIVGKLNASGEQLWTDQWGTSNRDEGTSLVALADGALILGGISQGQAPGNPPAVAGGLAVAKYDSSGTRAWIKQTTTTPSHSDQVWQLAGTGGDEFYVISGLEGDKIDRLAKFSASGTELWRFWLRYDTNRFEAAGPGAYDPAQLQGGIFTQVASDGVSLPRYFHGVAATPSGDKLFLSSNESVSNNAEIPRRIHLSAVSPDGDYGWFRSAGTRTAVLDAVEQVTWTGQFKTLTELAVSEDSVYLAGTYRNTYVNGAIPRPETWHAFVARYDHEGEQLWFRLFEDDTSATGDLEPSALAVDADGHAVVAFSFIGGSDAGYRLLRLRKTDGAATD